MTKVGFIGLGAMGKPMARNVLDKGFPLFLVEGWTMAAVEELPPPADRTVAPMAWKSSSRLRSRSVTAVAMPYWSLSHWRCSTEAP